MKISKSSTVVLIFTIIAAVLVSLPTNSLLQNVIPKQHTEDTNISNTQQLVVTQATQEKEVFKTFNKVSAYRDSADFYRSGHKTIKVLSYDDAVRVSSNDGYNVHPSVVSYGGNLLVVYEHRKDKSDLYIQISTDGGVTWSNTYNPRGPSWGGYPFISTNQTNPGLSITPDGYAICTFESDDNTSRLYMLEFPGIKDESSWFLSWLNLSYLSSDDGYIYHVENISSISISTPTNMEILISCAADITNVTEGITMYQIPLILYSSDGGYTFTPIFSEDTPYNYLSHSSASFDKGAYIVYQKNNGFGTDAICLYYPDGNVNYNWSDFDIPIQYDISNPDVFTLNNLVFIVFEANVDGNYGIFYYYSYDGGNSWQQGSKAIADTNESERYPSIFFDGTTLYCSFVRSGGLYLTTSDDLGQSWSTPEQISGTGNIVYSSYGADRLVKDKGIVWVNEEEYGSSIYFSSIGGSPPSPSSGKPDLLIPVNTISLKSSGERIVRNMKNILQFKIKNQGISDANDVEIGIYIRYKDDPDLIHVSSKTVLSIGAGEEKNVTVRLFSPVVREIVPVLIEFADISNMIIKIDPDNKIEESNESNNQYSLSVSYHDIFPMFGWLERIILRFLGNNRTSDVSYLEEVLVQMIEEDTLNQNNSSIKSLLSN